jgi:tetratricopeptide (TPR) repeat protein
MLLRSLAGQELSHGELVEGWKLAHRAHLLEPDNPADVVGLARTWVLLGQLDEAETLLLTALDQSGQNFNLLSVYWLNLLVSGRFEEAESLVKELMKDAGEELPGVLRKAFNMQLGMVALAGNNLPLASRYLNTAIGEEESQSYDSTEILTLTLASLVSGKLGQSEAAETQLANAERKIARARLNGVDDPGIYYSEATILAMHNNVPAALEKLQIAYDRGFRESWLMDLDWRLDSVRDEEVFIGLQARMSQDIERAVAEIRSLQVAVL